MRKKKKQKKRSKLRKFYCPGSLIVVTGACVYLLVPGFRELQSVRARMAKLEHVQRERKAGNEALKKEIASMKTSEGIERAARRHLRLARPDEVIVRFQPPEEGKSRER